jgi:hypothetical protein
VILRPPLAPPKEGDRYEEGVIEFKKLIMQLFCENYQEKSEQ